MSTTVKRKGHKEDFDARKIYASVFSACRALRMMDKEAELLAENVSKEVTEAFKNEEDVNSDEIHSEVVKKLKAYNPDAAFIYDTHRDIS